MGKFFLSHLRCMLPHFIAMFNVISCCKLIWCLLSLHFVFYAEVSDQNFVDNQPGELSGGMPTAKRLKKASSGFLDNAQVNHGTALDFSLDILYFHRINDPRLNMLLLTS